MDSPSHHGKSLPRETTSEGQPLVPATATPAPPAVTEAPLLRCTDGSTVLHTTDCTLGTPVAYCHKPKPPIKCEEGFFPSVWHPDHCGEEQTCFPLDADWITTECSNGAFPFTTTTLYEGTLADGEWTAVSVVSCACATDQWYSMTMLDGRSNLETFCMPYRSCPPGMTTSVSMNQYCATATGTGKEDVCADIQTKTEYCECANPMQTPVYADDPGEGAIGCE
ncbi:hypothetical protein N7532_007778 [Penicillium argentinense]|uniref:Uncharacterized protein n=1 Tax=Penicillium argentinense TaxID=1131581 RepID=A0A9W9EWA8_9EURO|nr:uncharacterized protein N7532_007778 [Penicillium argentinense]KAJ5089094.1 hypothetical protein N7532_007778 [Penicillium argentinense]